MHEETRHERERMRRLVEEAKSLDREARARRARQDSRWADLLLWKLEGRVSKTMRSQDSAKPVIAHDWEALKKMLWDEARLFSALNPHSYLHREKGVDEKAKNVWEKVQEATEDGRWKTWIEEVADWYGRQQPVALDTSSSDGSSY